MPMNFTFTGRKKLRLEWYDYSQDGYYFVTICSKNRECFFGEIIGWNMILSEMWNIVNEEIQNNIRDDVQIDEYIIMPNHIHIIIIIKTVGCDCIALNDKTLPNDETSPKNNDRWSENSIWAENGTMQSFPTLSRVIRWMKWRITSRIQKECKDHEFAWQKSFHDTIIRNQDQLDKSREYIRINPRKWSEDVNNSINIKRWKKLQ